MNPINKVQSLIDRACHNSTSEEESRTCALLAVKLIRKYELSVTYGSSDDNVDDEIQTYDSVRYREADPFSYVTEVKMFNTIISKFGGICIACNKRYEKGVIVAYCQSAGETVHFTCKRYFIDGTIGD